MKYFIAGVIAGLVFGTAAIFIRLLQAMDSMSIAFWRLIIGSLALLPLTLRSERCKGYSKFILLMGLTLSFHFMFFIESVKQTSILNATILVNTAPIQALILSFLMLKVKPSRLETIAVILGFSGASIVTFSSGELSGATLGDILALVSGTLLSLYAIIGYVARSRHGINTLYFMSRVYFIAAIITLAFIIIIGRKLELPITPPDITYVLCLGFVPTGIGHTLAIYSLKELKAYETETLALLEPLSATTLAYIMFSETPRVNSIIGSLIIICSLIILGYAKTISYKGKR